MAEDFIQLPVALSPGDKLRTQSNLIGANTVKQEVHTLADPDGTLVSSSLLAKDASITPLLKKADLAIASGGNLYTTDTYALKISQGKARIGGTTVTTSATNPNATFTVENPTGNTRNVFIVGFDIYASANCNVQYITNYASVNVSLSPLFNPNRAGGAPTSVKIYAGNTDAVNPTVQPIVSVVTANSPLKLQQFVILPPGQVMGVKASGASTGSSITANIFVFEE